ncbi:MAG: N-formylglutamate amidohydrolase [Deltaproteobacteria bacterium]|nr:N-formylglutamate amidohydrolase [Deltaproteobacteria bacterium]
MIATIADVVDVRRYGPEGPAELLIELPHGCTAVADYRRLAAQMRSTLPDDLEAFFCVNTDVGTPELGFALAEILAGAGWRVVVVRSRLPRTLVDCNRTADPERGAGLTGLMPSYVRDEADITLLTALHGAYLQVARAAWGEVLQSGGRGISLHSYAPRSVPIERVTDSIVAELRRYWATPEALPLRPEIDLIVVDRDGTLQADPALCAALEAEYAAIALPVSRSATYRLHPVAFAGEMALAAPLQVLTIEFRRDLLAAPWDPFCEMRIPTERAASLAAPLARALQSTRSA